MFQVAIIESIYDIKKMFAGFKIIFLFLIVLFIVIINSSKIEGNNLHMIYLYMYSRYLIRPRISKMHFILPIDQQYLKMYLYLKGFSFIILLILAYVISHSIIVAFGGYDLLHALKYFMCEDIPFLLCQVIFIIYISVDSKGSTLAINVANKKKNRWYVMAGICILLPMIHELGVFRNVATVWYAIITFLSYICAIYNIKFSIILYKDCTIDFEKLRNPRKLWSF
jgi:Na+-transporting methylmalonyl-CoA/oxaloacetate decarboxylase gamma subunit